MYIYCRGSIFSLNQNYESLKEKEKIREKIYAGVNPVVLQPASDQHVLLHSSLLFANILLINVRSVLTKELSFCHKIKSSDPNIFATWWCKPVIFQTYIIVSISINRLKNVRSKTLGYKDMEIRKSEFVAKTQLLYF